MTAEEHSDPLTEAAQIAVRDARRFVNLLAAAGRIIVRHQAASKRVREERDRQAGRAMQAGLKAERAAARARWAPANDPQWLRDAGLLNVAEVWAAALPYADRARELFEKSSESAVLNCESRLRDLHQYAMSRYDRLRADGMGPLEAMHEAIPLFTRPARAYERTAQARSALEPGSGHGFEWVRRSMGRPARTWRPSVSGSAAPGYWTESRDGRSGRARFRSTRMSSAWPLRRQRA
jgi:hypothetical protein